MTSLSHSFPEKNNSSENIIACVWLNIYECLCSVKPNHRTFKYFTRNMCKVMEGILIQQNKCMCSKISPLHQHQIFFRQPHELDFVIINICVSAKPNIAGMTKSILHQIGNNIAPDFKWFHKRSIAQWFDYYKSLNEEVKTYTTRVFTANLSQTQSTVYWLSYYKP